MQQANRELLKAGLEQYGAAPSESTIDSLVKHLELVVDWNERVNLTAITEEREMVLKHVIDSSSALSVVELNSGTKLLDVGTGAGFPGVVLKCLHPETRVTLLESLNKRCTFLKAVGDDVIHDLGGPDDGFEVLWGRAEDFGRDPLHRESYDVVVARAVADLRVLAEYCLPFCRVGGLFLAMKGPSAQEEIQGAEKALRILGGTIAVVKAVTLPENAGERTLIVVEKVKTTAPAYPRKAGTPSKNPL